MRWFVWKDGRRCGPISLEELRALIQWGEVTPANVVCREGSPAWRPVAFVAELTQLEPAGGSAAGPVVTPATALAPRGSYIARHWRGELPLAVSYWVNGTFASLAALMLTVVVGAVVDFSRAPRFWSALLIGVWFAVLAMSAWQVVGVWRSAGGHPGRGGSRRWAVAARVAVVVGVVQTAGVVATQLVPQVWEFGKVIAGRDPVSGYQIRLLRGGTEVEVSGYIAFGLTDRVTTTLNAYPGVTVIHLNTGGGRVAEARKLRDLIASRHLSTYVSTECASACVIPVLAGDRRLLAPDAKVGFHQYTFAGRATAATVADMETEKAYFKSRGVSPAFVERAFQPTSALWYPTHDQMLAARFITGQAAGDEVALSGMSLADIDKVDRSLRDDPLYAAIAEYDPDAYAKIAVAVRDGFQQGQTLADLRSRLAPLIQEVYRKRLPFASDTAVMAFGRLMVDQISVLSGDPDRCVAYLMPQGRVGVDFRSVFSRELVQREQSVMADVIRSAAAGSSRPPSEADITPIRSELFAQMLLSWSPDDLDQLAHLDRPEADPARSCRVCYGFYKAIVDMPEGKAAPMLRYTFASSH